MSKTIYKTSVLGNSNNWHEGFMVCIDLGNDRYWSISASRSKNSEEAFIYTDLGTTEISGQFEPEPINIVKTIDLRKVDLKTLLEKRRNVKNVDSVFDKALDRIIEVNDKGIDNLTEEYWEYADAQHVRGDHYEAVFAFAYACDTIFGFNTWDKEITNVKEILLYPFNAIGR